MTPTGKGYWIWSIPACQYGNTVEIASEAARARLTHVIIKVADGRYPYNLDYAGRDLVPSVVAALKSVGVEVWGWQWVNGDYPESEAAIAIKRIQSLGLAGFVVNAEGPYKELGRQGLGAERARRYMTAIRQVLPTLPIALSSYRYPTYHYHFPFSAFLAQCSLNMPQVYWQNATNPAAQLIRCHREYQAITPWRPMIPTGSAYKEWGWAATPAQVIEFLAAAEKLGLTAANFWAWDQRRYLPDVWLAIARYNWGQIPPPPPPQEPPTVPVAYTVWRLKPGVSALNVRESPWINDPAPAILWVLTGTQTVKLTTERQYAWAKLYGQPGWVNGSYLEKI